MCFLFQRDWSRNVHAHYNASRVCSNVSPKAYANYAFRSQQQAYVTSLNLGLSPGIYNFRYKAFHGRCQIYDWIYTISVLAVLLDVCNTSYCNGKHLDLLFTGSSVPEGKLESISEVFLPFPNLETRTYFDLFIYFTQTSEQTSHKNKACCSLFWFQVCLGPFLQVHA